MRRTTCASIFLAVAAAALSGAAGSAGPKPPPNDDRTEAEVLQAVPAHASGTTVGATAESRDPVVKCADAMGTVWYRFRVEATGKLAIRLRAHGQLEAALSVYRIDRSHLASLGCSRTDRNGLAGGGFKVVEGRSYLVVVARQSGSIPGRFDLRIVRPEGLESPPGKPLPAAGTWAGVDRLLDPDDAWAVDLRPGTVYRINLVHHSGRCLLVRLYEPGISDFRGEEPVRTWNCTAYTTFTPGPDGGGRYSLRVRPALSYRGPQPYRLSVTPAEPDDAAPGVFLTSGSKVAGSLAPRLDDHLDLYRFVVPRPGVLAVDLKAPRGAIIDLLVLTEDGAIVDEKLGQGPFRFRLELLPEHYYLALRAETGRRVGYRFAFFVRDTTTTDLLADGTTLARVAPRTAVALTAQVRTTTGGGATGASGGTMRFQLDRFDPFAGWNFVRVEPVRVAGDGSARLSWTPSTPGRWRAHAVFFGTDSASPSESRYVSVTVEEPLEP